MGVLHVWILDPYEKEAYAVDSANGLREVSGRIATADRNVVLALAEVFSGKELF